MLEQMIAGNGFPKVVVENDHCRVFQMMGGTGDGSMTQYDLYPGITLMYNDFHMEDYDSDLTITGDLLCIDYCRQGRMEYPAGPDAYSYVEAGDLKLDRRLEHRGHFVFPLSHYHGITVGLELPRAAQALAEWVRDFPVRQILLRPPPQGTPRGPFAGSYLPGALCRTGTDQAPLFPHQDAGTAPLSGCPGTARGVGEALLLQDAGGENESDSPPADRGSGASLHHH